MGVLTLTAQEEVSAPPRVASSLIIGKRFDDATVLRVAHTYEQTVGGFPAPPALTTTGSSA